MNLRISVFKLAGIVSNFSDFELNHEVVDLEEEYVI